jgi:hypothetical protein
VLVIRKRRARAPWSMDATLWTSCEESVCDSQRFWKTALRDSDRSRVDVGEELEDVAVRS